MFAEVLQMYVAFVAGERQPVHEPKYRLGGVALAFFREVLKMTVHRQGFIWAEKLEGGNRKKRMHQQVA